MFGRRDASQRTVPANVPGAILLLLAEKWTSNVRGYPRSYVH